MQIDHIALWTSNLELLKEFYEKYFHAKASNKYQNTAKQFESYFLSFSSGSRLELMSHPNISEVINEINMQFKGYIHVSFACGSKDNVDQLTERIHNDGYQVMSSPNLTGDGYYESVILDPDGNQVEITV